jgi:hypothetical protein
MDPEVIIVSGLPRCGTSLMMQMLEQGGVDILTDKIRAADTDNPRGYYEFERVKKIKQDASWLPATRGKAVKMVSQLLYDLPSSERYGIIFMERDMDEMLDSQEKLLQRLNQTGAPREKMRQAYILHLQRLHEWLRQQANMRVLLVRYNDLVERPEEEVKRVCDFLGRPMQVENMAKSVDPSLYRNRKANRCLKE